MPHEIIIHEAAEGGYWAEVPEIPDEAIDGCRAVEAGPQLAGRGARHA
jgi:hypothetical protein